MRKTAILILLAGFVFTSFAVEAAGIDLLIDSVGFLLAFNGMRGLARAQPGFAPGGAVCLGLVAVSALQLFCSGAVLAALSVARALGEAALYLLLLRGFWRMLGNKSPARRPAAAALGLNAAAAPSAALMKLLWPQAARAASGLLLGSHLLMLAALCLLAGAAARLDAPQK